MTNPTLIGPTKLERILQSLRAAGPAGVLGETLASLMPDVPETTIATTLGVLRRRGLSATLLDPLPWPQHRRMRHYAVEHAPEGWQAIAPPPRQRAKAGGTHPYRGPVRGHVRARLDHDQPTIVPPGVVVQTCPAGKDFRFTVPPGTPVAGAGFVAEWQQRLRRASRRTRTCSK